MEQARGMALVAEQAAEGATVPVAARSLAHAEQVDSGVQTEVCRLEQRHVLDNTDNHV